MRATLSVLFLGIGIVLLAASSAETGPYDDAVSADGPIGYWRLGEPPGSPVYPTEGGAQDATALDRDLTYVWFDSAADLGQPGAVAGDPDTSVQWNGTNAYLEWRLGSPSPSDFAFASGESFSIEYWLNTTQTSAAGLATKGYDASQSTPWYLMRLNTPSPGDLDLFLRGPGDRSVAATTPVNNGTWHHVVGVYDTQGGASTTDGLLKIYVDGSLEGITGGVGDAAYGTNSRNLVFGNHLSRFYDGLADELAIYNGPLDSGRVSIHHRVATEGGLPPYTDEVLGRSPLLGYWPLNDTPASIEAADLSGRGNHMDLSPTQAPTRGQPGSPADVAGTAYSFDGSNQVLFDLDYASTGADPDFQFGSGESFSIEFWMKSGQTPSSANVGLVTKGYDKTSQETPWYLMRMNTNGTADIFLRGPGGDRSAASNTAVNDDQWHHVVGVYDAGSAELRISIDGSVEETVGSVPAAAYGSNGRPLLFGRHYNRYYQGLLDEAAIYGEALPPNIISYHHEVGRGNPLPDYTRQVLLHDGIVGYWRLGETPGEQTAMDLSGRGNHMNFNPAQPPTPGATGIPGGKGDTAYVFDGQNDVLYINPYSGGEDADFEFAAGQSFSIELWMNTTQNPTTSQNVGLVTKGYDSTSQQQPWYLMRLGGAGEGLVDFYLRGPGGDSVVNSQEAVNDGTWHHIVGVYDADDAALMFYLDGLLQHTDPSVPEAAYGTNGRPLLLGRHYNRNYEGLFDEVAIYNLALTGDEVWQHYAAGMVPEPASVVLLAVGGMALVVLGRRRVRARRARSSG